MVSIIIPCFNQGHLLAGAIESALKQTYRDVQVIVVNDGSTDETEQVCNRYRNRIVYLEQKNRGVCAARNAGIRVASERYLHFLDADDLLHPCAIEWLVSCMDHQENRLALMGFRGLSGDGESFIGEDGLPANAAAHFIHAFAIDPLFVERPGGLDPERLSALPFFIYTNFGPPHCFLTSRSMVLEVGGFDEGLSGCGDWDLWLRLALAGAELVATPRAGAYYRRSPDSMSFDVQHMRDDRARVLLKAIRSIKSQPDRFELLAQHLLQASKRIRRRYAAVGALQNCRRDLDSEIRMLQKFNAARHRRLLNALLEFTLGPAWDKIALGYYGIFRPELVEYYRNGID